MEGKEKKVFYTVNKFEFGERKIIANRLIVGLSEMLTTFWNGRTKTL